MIGNLGIILNFVENENAETPEDISKQLDPVVTDVSDLRGLADHPFERSGINERSRYTSV